MFVHERLFLLSHKRLDYIKQVEAQKVVLRNACLKVRVLLYAVGAETFMRGTDRQYDSDSKGRWSTPANVLESVRNRAVSAKWSSTNYIFRALYHALVTLPTGLLVL